MTKAEQMDQLLALLQHEQANTFVQTFFHPHVAR